MSINKFKTHHQTASAKATSEGKVR
uniref:Uncharacterized protein n=1 Tax=Anopheles albimanus TaxID=7167 RepID=A0A182FYD3_ANOAL